MGIRTMGKFTSSILSVADSRKQVGRRSWMRDGGPARLMEGTPGRHQDEVGVKTSFEPRAFASLNACSLTARAFLPASQRTLFKSLTWKQDKLAQASSVLVASPHMASYVRDLHLIDAGFITEPDSDSIRVPLAASFSLLRNITRLALSFSFNPLGWTRIPADFRAVLVSLLSLPSLRYIALAQCTGVPSSIIRHALLSSKQVTLKDVSIYSEDEVLPEITGDASGASVPLEHLAVFYTQQFSLSIPVYAMLLCASSQDIDTPIVGLDSPIDLPNLPGLRFLILKARMVSWLPSPLMDTIPSLPTRLPAIQVLKILVEAVFRPGDSNHHIEAGAALTNLPRLREVHFGARRAAAFAIESTTRQRFPLASEVGLLTFSLSNSLPRYDPMAMFSD
ncbi:hypothetical protein B0H17DRAFT_1142240 [Mycena rosella]|uniref:Uncharacterized protein n=1 Tax=Mycena rosella TaxID=1033263 RepID=A0AAD7CYB8_MYCRO|nr:hypothetical protein B0H17DRAFT_1142240 [Mycena rosella]